MDFITIILMALALSMDAFAVALTNGICVKNIKLRHMIQIGLAFGIFQALMPLIGYFVGKGFRSLIEKFDHWIAFALLVVIGGKMIYDSIKEKTQGLEGESCPYTNPLKFKVLLVLAIATSLDALAVGISLAMVEVNIVYAASVIGIITAVISFAGVIIGKKWGHLLGNKTEIAGGIMLILIGLRILLEGLNIIKF